MSNLGKISKGSRIESNKMIMVVTGETEKSFLGYYEYKGKMVGQCSMLKDTLVNPHFKNSIKVL